LVGNPKSEIRMNDEESPKRYDLEERTFLFDALNSERDWLINEARELTSIFGVHSSQVRITPCSRIASCFEF
jgi:hypothetical protein